MPAARVTVYRRDDGPDRLRVTADTTLSVARAIADLSVAGGVDEVVSVFEDDGTVTILRAGAGFTISAHTPAGDPGSAADCSNEPSARAERLRRMHESDPDGGQADDATGEALRAFAAAFSTGLAINTHAENLTCDEAFIFAELLRVAGADDAADRLIAAHRSCEPADHRC